MAAVPATTTTSNAISSAIPSVNEALFESEYINLFTNIKSAVDSFIGQLYG